MKLLTNEEAGDILKKFYYKDQTKSQLQTIDNELVSIVSNKDYTLIHDKIKNKIFIKTQEDITFDIETQGDINLSCNSFNLLTKEKICFDSLTDDDIHFNSKMAKQIRNNPESIEYRKQEIENVAEHLAEQWKWTVKEYKQFIEQQYKKLEITDEY